MNEGSKLEEIIGNVFHLIKGDRILDVGTGFGTVVTKLLHADGLNVVSIDPEAWRFDELREEFRDQITDGRLRLEKAGVENMPFKDKEFTTTIAISSFHHVSNIPAAFKEIERVTSSRVIITDWDPVSSGIYNPHSALELGKNKDSIISAGKERGFNIEEKGNWFLVWK